MLVVNSLVPVHLALPMIRNFSWGQHFLQRWMDLFSVFKMFTSTSRFPSPAILLVGGARAPHTLPAGENRGILRWNSNPKGGHCPFPFSWNSPLSSFGGALHEEIAVHPTNPSWDLGAPVPQGSLWEHQNAGCRYQGSLMLGTIQNPIPTVQWSTWSWLQAAESSKSLNVCPRSSGSCPKPLRGLFYWCGTGLLESV